MRRVLVAAAVSHAGVSSASSSGLFGDAATASLIEVVNGDATAGGVIRATSTGTDGRGEQNLIIPTSAMKGFVGAETTKADQPTFQMKRARGLRLRDQDHRGARQGLHEGGGDDGR